MASQWTTLLLGLCMGLCVIGASVGGDIACSYTCPILHPQQQFCNADVVMKVKALDSDFINSANEVVQHTQSDFMRVKATILTLYKESPDYGAVSDTVYFYSPSFTCSISTLRDGDVYVIGGKFQGNLLVVTGCDGISMKFDNITENQLKGFEGRYGDECDICTINGAATTKFFGGAEAALGLASGFWSPEGCFFNPIPSGRYGGKDCETLYSFCMPRPSDGKCSWESTVDYDDCYQAREDTWFFLTKGQAAYTCRSQCNTITDKLAKYKCARATKKLERQGHTPC